MTNTDVDSPSVEELAALRDAATEKAGSKSSRAAGELERSSHNTAISQKS